MMMKLAPSLVADIAEDARRSDVKGFGNAITLINAALTSGKDHHLWRGIPHDIR